MITGTVFLFDWYGIVLLNVNRNLISNSIKRVDCKCTHKDFCCRRSTLTDKMQNGFVEFNGNGWRNIQKAVTVKTFYGSTKGRYDTVLVSEDKDEEKCHSINTLKEISGWFAKALVLVRVVSGELENDICELHEKKSCIECVYDAGKERCFVQWYEVLDEKFSWWTKSTEKNLVSSGSGGTRMIVSVPTKNIS